MNGNTELLFCFTTEANFGNELLIIENANYVFVN